jgi:hypothetical protein
MSEEVRVMRANPVRMQLASAGVAAAVVAIAAGVGAARVPGWPETTYRTATQTAALDISFLDRLLDERRFFELRDALRGTDTSASLDALFFRGVTASRFNRIDEALRLLTTFLDRSGTEALTAHVREAYASIADLHRRQHRYGALVDSRRRMMTAFQTRLTSSELSGHEDRLRLWNALRDVPPQTVDIGSGADVPLVDGVDIRVAFPRGDVLLNPDTGSGLSIITRSDAVRLGLRVIEVPVGVATTTGSQAATLAVAPEMRIGGVVIRHAVFLVFPDAALFRARQGIQRHGTVGAPVLAALGTITFTRDGRFIVHTDAPGASGTDVFLEDFDPIAAAQFAGRPLRLAIDTGASETTFWPPFERECRDALPAGAQRVEREVGSVGRTRRFAMLEVPGIAVDVGPARVAFPNRRLVLLDATTDDHRVFHGSLGRDLYQFRERLTISYTAMRMAVGPP